MPLKPNSHPSDLALVEGLTQGNHTAFHQLYLSHDRQVYQAIIGIVRNPCVAEELMQEVFLKAWTRSASFELWRSPCLRAWLCAIARNQAIDYLRSCESKLEYRSRELLPIDSPCEHSGTEERITREQQAALMMRALCKLTDSQRQVLDDVYFQGLSHTQAALLRGRPLGTVKTWVRKGIASLRTEMMSCRVA